MPSITLCVEKQFNAVEGINLGYLNLYQFVTGKMLDIESKRSWNGASNLTYQQTVGVLFKAEYDDVRIIPGDIIMEDKFILPFGNCKNIRTCPMSEKWWLKIMFKGPRNISFLSQILMRQPISPFLKVP